MEETPPSPKALQGWVSDRSVAILLSPSGGGLFVGSAVGIEICGRYFLATAAHNLRNINHRRQIRALPGGRRLERPLHLLQWNSLMENSEGEVDVAWLEIEVVSAASSSARFISIDSLLCGAEHQDETVFFVHGYPRDAVDRDDLVDGSPLLTSVGLGSFSIPASAAADGFQAGIDLVVQWPPPDLGKYEVDLPEPWGVSGGGVWLIPRYRDDPHWSTSDLKLLATNRCWLKKERQLKTTRIEHWLRLLCEDQPGTEKEIGPVLEGNSQQTPNQAPAMDG